MLLRSVQLINLKSFADSGELALGNPTVLIGENNSGKSAIIKALSLVQTSPVRLGDIRIGQPGPAVVRVLLGQADLVPRFSKFEAQVVAESQRRSPEDCLLEITVHASNPQPMLTFASDQANLSAHQVPNVEPANLLVPYLSRRRLVGYARQVDRASELAVTADLTHLTSKVQMVDRAGRRGHELYASFCDQILGAMITTFGGDNGSEPGVVVADGVGIPLDAMGEGVANMLGLVTSLVRCDHKVYLIEEPENDLHPKALRTLLELILERSDSNQFIVSTHSNIVLRMLGAPEEAVIYKVSVSKGYDVPTSRAELVPPEPSARLALLDELGYGLADLYHAEGWIIFEESSAEQLAREVLIPWFAPELGQFQTVGAKGVDDVAPRFVHYERLLCYAHLDNRRAWVIVDGDAPGLKVAGQLRKEYANRWSEDHFLALAAEKLEDCYPPQFADDVKAAFKLQGQAKREAKSEILKKMLAWAKADRAEAEPVLRDSAADLIQKLQAIEAQYMAGRQ